MRTVCSKSDHILQLNTASGGTCKNRFALIVGARSALSRQLQTQGLHVRGLVGNHERIFLESCLAELNVTAVVFWLMNPQAVGPHAD